MNVKTILFVENDPVALQMYRCRLEREGFHLDTAQDGLEALKILSELTPDLVVLDMMLPKPGGEDVIQFVRADPRLKALPLVIFSNTPTAQLGQEVISSGPTRHLLKSDCTFPILLQTIQDLLAVAPAGTAVATAPPNIPPIPAPPASASVQVAPAPVGEATHESSEFLRQAAVEIPKIRDHCFAYIKAPASPGSLQHLPNLYQRVHLLNANAGKAGCARVALLTRAFDALLSEIMVKPSWVTPSVLQTIAQAVDCLGRLLTINEAELAQPMPPAKVLAVDDDAVCNHVMTTTLKRAKFDARCVDDPIVALQLLEATPYDLVLLDINMPGMTGFELCEKLRRFPHAKNTPVIFITGHNNFDNRKQSVLSGGQDFITKPVSPSELVLKTTIHLLKSQARHSSAPEMESHSPQADATMNPPQPAAPNGSHPAANGESLSIAVPSSPSPHKESASARAQNVPAAEQKAQPVASIETPQSQPGKPEGTVPSLSAAASVTETGTTNVSEDIPQPGDPLPNNGSNDTFDKIVHIVTKIMFDDDNPTDRNKRLVRLALEHQNLRGILDGHETGGGNRTQHPVTRVESPQRP